MSARERPLRADAARNRAAIVTAARAAFETRGVETSLDDIARDAGVGVGTLYRHFPTRGDLIAEALKETVGALDALALRLVDELDQCRALAEWMHALAAFSTQYGGVPDAAASSVAAGASDLNRVCHRLDAHTTTLVSAAQRAGLVRQDVTSDDLFVMSMAVAWADAFDPQSSRVTERIEMILRGAAPGTDPNA